MKRSRSEKHWSHLHRQAEHTAHHSPHSLFCLSIQEMNGTHPDISLHIFRCCTSATLFVNFSCSLYNCIVVFNLTSHITFELIFNDVWIKVQRHDVSGKQAFLFSPTFLSIKSNFYQSLSLTGKHSCAINESQFTRRLHQSSCRTGE